MFPACRLTVTGIDDALARVDGVERAIKLAIVVELERFGRKVMNQMVETHTFNNITGQLERSIGYTVEEWQAGKVVANIFAMATYAQAVEDGTPTSRPYPFFWPVIYEHLPELMERLPKAVNEALAEFADTARGAA